MTTLIKYPKTFHLPTSPGLQNDDRMMTRVPFGGKRVIITEKMDGENTTMYNDHIHARSLDSAHHSSRDWVKTMWGVVKHNIPEGMRICGENMYALHSIPYDNLESYFLGFSMWDGEICLDWDTTVDWFNLLDVVPVPVLYDGVYSNRIPIQVWGNMDREKNEGLVVRLASSFTLDEFQQSVGKFVREQHVQTDDKLWRLKPIVPNKLKVS